MTRTRVIAALILAPLAIAAILLLPTPWMVALAAVVFLAGLWEWFRLADIEDTLARTALLVVNMALMVAIVWGSRTSHGFNYVLLQLMTVLGVVWWLLAMLWLKHYDFASDHTGNARVYKLAAGTLAIVPAWCALGVLHGSDPDGHRWLFIALATVWAADSGAYFAGRHFGKRKLSPRISPNTQNAFGPETNSRITPTTTRLASEPTTTALGPNRSSNHPPASAPSAETTLITTPKIRTVPGSIP